MGKLVPPVQISVRRAGVDGLRYNYREPEALENDAFGNFVSPGVRLVMGNCQESLLGKRASAVGSLRLDPSGMNVGAL